MMKRGILCSLILVLQMACLSAQEVKTYGFVERDSTLYLDVYRPASPRADKACVLTLFGGGFVTGERNNALQRTIGKMLSERGFTVVSIKGFPSSFIWLFGEPVPPLGSYETVYSSFQIAYSVTFPFGVKLPSIPAEAPLVVLQPLKT